MEQAKKKKIIKYSLFSLLLIGVLTCFILLAVAISNGKIFNVDNFFLNLSHNMERDWLTIIMQIITNLVNPITLAIIALILLFVAKRQKGNSLALFLNMAIMVTPMLGLKLIFTRERPTGALIEESGYSFPSGHSFCALAFYGFLVYMLLQSNMSKGKKITFSILLNIIVLLVSYSRIYLCVHYFTDIIGGLLISFIYLFIFCFVIHKIKLTKESQKSEYKKHSFIEGFKYASQGIIKAIQEENNLIVQFCITMLVIVFGISLKISAIEWCVCLILCFIVMCFEIFNTAIENICDSITLEQNEKIKHIKDISAGAVWLMSICSVIVALIIFIPKISVLF